MLVRKSEIINILSESRLASGDFINEYGETCAVGALVKALNYGLVNQEIRELAQHLAPAAMRPSARPYIESGDYLSALSIHFENVMYAYDDVYTEEVREEILGFVNKFFPDEVSINV